MNFLRLVLLSSVFSFVILSSVVHAQKVEAQYFAVREAGRAGSLDPITTDDIKLVGRGVHVKGSTEGLVLSCLTPTCQELRFIYITDDRRAFYTGPIYSFEQSYQLDDQVTDEALDANAKSVMTRVLKGVEKINHRRTGRGILLVIGGTIIGGALLPIAGPAPMLIGLGISGIVALSDNQGRILEGFDVVGGLKNTFLKNSRDARLFVDKNGWNWSVKPKKMPKEKFMALRQAIF